MPSSRRVKVLGLTVALIVLSILYITSSARHSNHEFYERTVKAMEAHAAAKARSEGQQEPLTGPKLPDPDSDALNGKTEAQVPVDAGSREPVPDVKAPPDVVSVGDGNKKEEEKGKGGGVRTGEERKKWDTSGKDGEGKEEGKKEEKEEKSEEERRVEVELNAILKRSPIIIFSKSYCPYSKKAKAVFASYSITPAPFIVELDQHELGPGLQAALAKTTKRKTVPNVLVGGVSIGGGDDVVDMDERDQLVGKIRELGGKRIMEVKRKG